jgi:hypothetical protein
LNGIVLGPEAPSSKKFVSTLYQESSSTEELKAFKDWGGNKVFINNVVNGNEVTCTQNGIGELPVDPTTSASEVVCTHKLEDMFDIGNNGKVSKCKAAAA